MSACNHDVGTGGASLDRAQYYRADVPANSNNQAQTNILRVNRRADGFPVSSKQSHLLFHVVRVLSLVGACTQPRSNPHFTPCYVLTLAGIPTFRYRATTKSSHFACERRANYEADDFLCSLTRVTGRLCSVICELYPRLWVTLVNFTSFVGLLVSLKPSCVQNDATTARLRWMRGALNGTQNARYARRVSFMHYISSARPAWLSQVRHLLRQPSRTLL